MSSTWSSIECAIIDWVQRVLPELSEEQFRWADQNIPIPTYPSLTMRRDSIIDAAPQDEVRESTDLTRPIGQEIALETISIREFTLSLQLRVDEKTGGNDPDCDAIALMGRLKSSLAQESSLSTLCLGGLAVIERFAIVNLSELVNTQMISRASMDVRFRATFTCIEYTGYIDRVQISSGTCNPSDPMSITDINIDVSVD